MIQLKQFHFHILCVWRCLEDFHFIQFTLNIIVLFYYVFYHILLIYIDIDYVMFLFPSSGPKVILCKSVSQKSLQVEKRLKLFEDS